MTDAFFGGEMDAFTPSDSGVFEDASQAGSFDTEFCRCAIRTGAPGATSAYLRADHASLTTHCSRFDYFMVSVPPFVVGSEFVALSLFNSVGLEVFRLTVRPPNNDTVVNLVVRAYSWNGSAFVQVGAGFTYNCTTRTPFNLNLVAGTGAFAIYTAGSLRDSGTGTAFSNIAQVRFYNPYQPGYVSQVRVADYSLVGCNLKSIPPDTAGTNTAWVGGPTDVNEITYSDASYISSTSNGDIETYTNSTIDLSPYSIQGFGVSSRANCGASGPQHEQLALRVSGTNYFSPSILQAVGYAVSQHIWATNPATSAAWDPADAELAEFGVKAIT